MLSAALVIAMAAGTRSPLDGRLPAHGQVQEAFSASRTCQGDSACQPVTMETRDESCHRIEVPRGRDGLAAVAGARCHFRYRDSIVGAHGPLRPPHWTRTRADFFLIGTPCGGEGQEADLICYSWMLPRGQN